MAWQIYKDGKLHSSHKSHSDAWLVLLKAQGQSTCWAQKYGGWAIVEATNKPTTKKG